jgi:deoxyribose-phosphate aldolase
MKYIEYQAYDLDDTEAELKTKIEKALAYKINAICVPYAYTKIARALAKNSQTLIANAIDYPLGLSDTESRNKMVLNSIENGAQKINIVLQNNYLVNKKYDKIKQDVQSNATICLDRSVELNYYLEYRIFTHQSLIKACGLLSEYNIKKVYVSTGYLLDSPEDNLIATMLLKQKSTIEVIFSGNLWNKKQIHNLNKNNVDTIRTNTILGLDLIYNK